MNAVIKSVATVSPETIELNRAIKKAWLSFISIPGVQVTPSHHAVYAILRGKSLEKTFPPRKYSLNGEPLNVCQLQSEDEARRLTCHALAPFASLLEGCERSSKSYTPCYASSETHPLLSRLIK